MDARALVARSRAATRLLGIATATAILVAACATPAASPTGAPGTPYPSAAPTAAPATEAPAAEPTPEPSAALFPVDLVDDEGTAVTLPAEPQKIATLTPAATEVIFELGLGDRLVGKVEDFTPYPPEAAEVPDVARFGSVDVEKIVAEGTELVIAGGSSFNPPESIAKLRELGVPVLVVFAPDVAGALADIELIGRATGRPDEASAIAGSITTAMDEVRAATADLPAPRVFYELDASNGYFGPAPDYFGTEMIKIAGGEPLTSGTPGVYQIEAEQILSFDPQVVLLGDAAYGVTPDQVKERAGWETLSAVKDDAIRPIDDVIVTRPGPRLAEGIKALATAIHPDLELP